MLGHEANINTFKRTEVVSTFSEHSGVKLEFSAKKKFKKFTVWKVILLSNQLVKEITRKIMKYLEDENEDTAYQNLWVQLKLFLEGYL